VADLIEIKESSLQLRHKFRLNQGIRSLSGCCAVLQWPIPETIDAIRALTGREKNASASVAKTNAALGIGAPFIR